MRTGPSAKYLGDLVRRWSVYVRNISSLWGVDILYFKMIPEAHSGEDVLDDGDRRWRVREEYPTSLKELFGEELVVTKDMPVVVGEGFAKFYCFKIKAFWKENPTTLELSSIGIVEKRDLLIGISKDLWDEILNNSDCPIKNISPLPGDLIQLYPLQLHPEWFEKDQKESYYHYYPGAQIYKVKDVLPVPGRLVAPPLGFSITADFWREIKKIVVINEIK
ncbi:MAG: hypothetical protein QXI58_01440 [Candidatus Micrarchaeia archaeon]